MPSPGLSAGIRYDFLPLFSQSFNPKSHNVAFLQELGGCHPQSDSGRRSGTDDVSGLQAHVVADVMYKIRDIKHHGACISILNSFSVQLEPKRERPGIRNFVSRDQVGADRAEGVTALPLDPLTT